EASRPFPSPVSPWHDAQHFMNIASPSVASFAVSGLATRLSEIVKNAKLSLAVRRITTVPCPIATTASRVRHTNSAAGCGRSDWIAVVHPLRALPPLNLHLPGSDFLGHRRSQFQNSVLVSRFEVFGLQTLWQLDRSLERSVARLAPIVMAVLGLLAFF